jgi:hypothetical protein
MFLQYLLYSNPHFYNEIKLRMNELNQAVWTKGGLLKQIDSLESHSVTCEKTCVSRISHLEVSLVTASVSRSHFLLKTQNWW